MKKIKKWFIRKLIGKDAFKRFYNIDGGQTAEDRCILAAYAYPEMGVTLETPLGTPFIKPPRQDQAP